MKTVLVSIQKKASLILLASMLTGSSYAAVFTASSSGNYSSTSTWTGGVVPPATVLADQLVILSGVTVNMDNNVIINGSLASLDVEGTLTSATSSLTLTLGTISGAGTIVANTAAINVANTFTFTGTFTTNTLNSTTGFTSSADIIVAQSLNLTNGALSLVTGGSLDVINSGTITVSGGTLSLGAGGSIGLASAYNVVYSGLSSTAGMELSGAGLRDLTVGLTSGNTLTLASDLTIGGTLTLTSGILALAGNDLSINGLVSSTGTGVVSSTPLSNVSINTSGGTLGSLTFGGLTPTVNNLTVNVGAGNQARIAGTVAVNGTLQLNSGILNFSNTNLTIGGNISGLGSLSGNATSNLTINSLTAPASSLNFVAGGQTINNLSVAVGLGNTPSLVSGLTVNGILSLTGSNFNLNGNSLTLGAASTIAGTGALLASSTSNLIINSTAGVPALLITGTLGSFTVNTGTGIVGLVNDLVTAGTLTLQSGTLKLNGKNLTINGDVAALGGTGTISSTLASDISIVTPSSLSGALRFAPATNTVGNLIVNITNSGSANIGSDLHVADTLRFVAGSLNIAGNALIVNTTGAIVGATSTSYVMTTINGYLEMRVISGGSNAVNFPIGTSTRFAPANIHLNTGSPSGQVKVGVTNDVFAQGISGLDLSIAQPLVDATWYVHSDITSNLNLNLQVLWSAAMEVNSFTRNAAFISHFMNGSWNTSTATAATVEAGGMYSLQTTGLTSLSPFSVFNQNTATAINEVNTAISFDVFPNPATDNIMIQNPMASSEAVNMEIYSAVGQLVSSYKLTEATSTISVKELVKGNYFIKFYNNSMNSTKAFIKM